MWRRKGGDKGGNKEELGDGVDYDLADDNRRCVERCRLLVNVGPDRRGSLACHLRTCQLEIPTDTHLLKTPKKQKKPSKVNSPPL